MTVSQGQAFGPFTLLEPLETTPVCETWRAAERVDGHWRRHVLAEIIHPDLRRNPAFVQAYLNRGQVLSQVAHPGILKRLSTVEQDQYLVSIYEYLEGFTLKRLLSRSEEDGLPFAPDHAIAVCAKILNALAHAREQSLAHGFVNPMVISVTSEGDVKLRDFALGYALRNAAASNPSIEDCHRNYVPGSTRGNLNKDVKDVYAVGAIFFEMLTGAPFDASREPATLLTSAHTAYAGETIPAPIQNLLVSALDPKTPSAFADVRAMNEAMAALLASDTFQSTTFNLAFFMHTVFREEIDDLVEKVKAEQSRFGTPKTQPISAGVIDKPKGTGETESTKARDKWNNQEEVVRPKTLNPNHRKKGFPWLLATAAVLVAAVSGILLLSNGQEPETDLLAMEKEKVQQQAVMVDMRALQQQRKEVQKQNELLREQLRQQAAQQNELRKEALEEEMRRMDEEIERLKTLEEQARKQEDLQKQLAKMEREKKAAQALARRERRLREKAQQRQEQRTEPEVQENPREVPKTNREVSGQRKVAQPSAPPKADAPAEEPAKLDTGDLTPVPPSPSSPVASPDQTARMDTIARVGEPGVTPPRFINRPPPTYPSRALQYKVEGYVILEAVLQGNGKVGEIRVLRDLGKGKLGFEEAAMLAVRNWRFQPGKVNGRRDDVRMTIKVDFKL